MSFLITWSKRGDGSADLNQLERPIAKAVAAESGFVSKTSAATISPSRVEPTNAGTPEHHRSILEPTMNKKLYSLVWNKSLHQVVVVSELETAKTGNPAEAETARTKLEILLEVLCLLFDSVGEDATPILSNPDGEVKRRMPSNVHSTDWANSLITLLSAGLDDKAIARKLDVSSSTLGRRIRNLMSIYGVHTRFQLGLQIARSNAVAPQ